MLSFSIWRLTFAFCLLELLSGHPPISPSIIHPAGPMQASGGSGRRGILPPPYVLTLSTCGFGLRSAARHLLLLGSRRRNRHVPGRQSRMNGLRMPHISCRLVSEMHQKEHQGRPEIAFIHTRTHSHTHTHPIHGPVVHRLAVREGCGSANPDLKHWTACGFRRCCIVPGR